MLKAGIVSSRLAALAILFTVCKVGGQVNTINSISNPDTAWRLITSENFDLIFPVEVTDLAIRTARLLDYVINIQNSDYSLPKKKLPSSCGTMQ